MEISEQLLNEAIVINLSGTIDHTVGHAIERTIQRVYKLGNRNVIFNLSDVTFIDGAGLGVFCFALHTLRQMGIQRSLINPPAPLRELLEQSDMRNRVPIYHSELEARTVS